MYLVMLALLFTFVKDVPKSSFSRCCLSGFTFKYITFFFYIEIKGYGMKIAFVLLEVYRNIMTRSTWESARAKDSSSPESGQH